MFLSTLASARPRLGGLVFLADYGDSVDGDALSGGDPAADEGPPGPARLGLRTASEDPEPPDLRLTPAGEKRWMSPETSFTMKDP